MFATMMLSKFKHLPLSTRIPILLFLLGLAVFTSLHYLNCKVGGSNDPESRKVVMDYQDKDYYLTLLNEREEQHKQYVASLKKQISELKLELARRTEKISKGAQPVNDVVQVFDDHVNDNDDLNDYLQQQIDKAEVRHGFRIRNEYEIIPFNMFTPQRIYQLEMGLYRHPEEKPTRKDKKDELIEAVEYALELLNSQKAKESKQFTVNDFVEGLYRTERNTGTQYELFFRSGVSGSIHRMEIFRPFGPLLRVNSEVFETSKATINIILPLAGRMEAFRIFMQNFREVGLKHDRRVFLTVVYFGQEHLQEVENTLESIGRETGQRSYYKLIALNEEFSRGKGLEVGAKAWDKGNVLLFFCDVDIWFTLDFLDRCRYSTVAGKKVFYPILFSLYNPSIVYAQESRIPPLEQQLSVKKDTGFWRDFGFGMTCQYLSDFLNIGGFDLDIKGWGGEDVSLYRKYVNSNLIVIRVPVKGLFHMYHEKTCDVTLSEEQYRMCIQSKAVGEASHAQLGMLAFKEEVQAHKASKKH
ncbi:chondroitin sulfate N-acetylgalactosaminyltransferase 1-like [Branchiostoma lanceolatum]|uniref:Hexosyltransferase n=1 Tax=Branchiostoma lanceolatum TaxID=7740 RepID=A0A8J9Z452_BRALA|nr:CSGALNACT1 [Branchiostoma lanceolatum]